MPVTRTSATATRSAGSISTAPIRRSGEGPAFYWPQVGDPNPTAGTHPIYSGARHVWRTLAFGGGTANQAGPQPTTPDIAFMESHCQEFVTGSTTLGCGDYRPMGGPYCDAVASTPAPTCINQPGDLAGTFYGADRAGLVVSWVARDSADHGTVWAATGAGRIFVTHNGDASDPSTITWHRIDNPSSPTRYVERDLSRPGEPEARVDLVLGLQRGYSDDAGSRIRGDRTGRARHGARSPT